MCSICSNPSCADCNQVVEAKGLPGQPAFLNMSFIAIGIPFQDNSNNWVEAGRFDFSKDIADIFISMRANIWRTGGATVNFRIRELIGGTIIGPFSVTSTSVVNIEKKKALQIFNATEAIMAVEVQSVGGNTVNIGNASFAYEK